MADFETTTDAKDCRVWGWGIHEIADDGEDVTLGSDIDSFMESIKHENSVIYFHNLRFDGAFIMYWLLTNGFTHTTERTLEPEQFTTLISGMGQTYSMRVNWGRHVTEFRDSLKKLPMKVSEIAKAFKLPMLKGEIDYHTTRPVGHVLTAEERDYISNDVLIVSRAMREVLSEGMTKLTVGSDSLAEYKRIAGGMYDARFPVLHPDYDAGIRRAYRGGFTYADERFRGVRQGGGVTLDVNSLYPFIMRARPIPYGHPTYQRRGVPEPQSDRPLWIAEVTMTARLRDNHIPCIQVKGSRFRDSEYLREIVEPETIYVTNVDWKLFNEHYDIDVISWGESWHFKAQRGMFDDYIDKWMEVKANSTGGRRALAKLHLNSLYGKFATNPKVSSKYPTLEDGRVKLVMSETETRDPVYTPAGVFITAWARDYTIRAAQENYTVFAYADTDSLHLLTDTVPDNLKVHPTELGAWKLEYHFDAALYMRAKAYMERLPDGTYENRIAGYPVHLSAALTFDDAVSGAELPGKLVPKMVPGGVVLTETPYRLDF